jgi:hypothetical protein
MFTVSPTPISSSPGDGPVFTTLAATPVPISTVTISAVPISAVPISAVGSPVAVGPGDGGFTVAPVPLPRPDGAPGFSAGSAPLIQLVAGGAGDDTLVLQAGGVAFGGGGKDTFVLISKGGVEGSELLGLINDFGADDSLDLSQLGPNAQILGREQPAGPWGPERIAIDFDGDGKEDGHLLVSEGRPPLDFGLVRPMPMPTPAEGDFHILPFPYPADGGEAHILPFPLTGEALSVDTSNAFTIGFAPASGPADGWVF